METNDKIMANKTVGTYFKFLVNVKGSFYVSLPPFRKLECRTSGYQIAISSHETTDLLPGIR